LIFFVSVLSSGLRTIQEINTKQHKARTRTLPFRLFSWIDLSGRDHPGGLGLLNRRITRRFEDLRWCKTLLSLNPGSKWPANLSSLARSSAQLRSPYWSNFRARGGGHPGSTEHDAWFPQLFGRPPTSTVAVKDCPPPPDLSTMIEAVPCPLAIFPADTVQLKVSLADGSPVVIFAENVSVGPSLKSGQATVTTGQLCEYDRSAPAERTKSNKRKEAYRIYTSWNTTTCPSGQALSPREMPAHRQAESCNSP
jgi:hypothetical protein